MGLQNCDRSLKPGVKLNGTFMFLDLRRVCREDTAEEEDDDSGLGGGTLGNDVRFRLTGVPVNLKSCSSGKF